MPPLPISREVAMAAVVRTQRKWGRAAAREVMALTEAVGPTGPMEGTGVRICSKLNI